jgi:hypothetical protein
VSDTDSNRDEKKKSAARATENENFLNVALARRKRPRQLCRKPGRGAQPEKPRKNVIFKGIRGQRRRMTAKSAPRIFDYNANIIKKNIELHAKKYFHKVLACSGDVYYYITKSPKHRGDELKTETLG